jgi:myosin light chain 6
MPPKKDVPVKKPAGPSISKPAAKPTAGAPPAKTKAEPAVSQAPVKTQEPPVDLSKVVVSSQKVRREFGGIGSRVGYSLGDGEYVECQE